MKTIKEMMCLSGRTVLVTGGAGHLGQAFGLALAELGASVALVDRRLNEAKECADKITSLYNVKSSCFEIELSDSEAVRELPQRVASELGGLDIIVNNAGFVGTDKLTGWCVPFDEQSIETWRAATEVNMTAPFFLVQAALPFLKAQNCGSVINISSIYGFLGPDMRIYSETGMGENAAAYAVSKGGLIQSTRWLATVLAPHVRVNCVSPGGIWRNQPDLFVERYVSKTPLGRMGAEDDITGIIAYLASDLSKYVTGQHIAVDGGWSAW